VCTTSGTYSEVWTLVKMVFLLSYPCVALAPDWEHPCEAGLQQSDGFQSTVVGAMGQWHWPQSEV